MEVIIALLHIIGFILILSMAIIVPIFVVGMAIHSKTSGQEHTPEFLWKQFKEMVKWTITYTVIGAFLMVGFSVVKSWFTKKD